MTQADFGIALIIFLITLGFTLYVYFSPYRREQKVTQAYKLYKVRDDLIFLVAQEKLHEHDLLFQIFYHAVNLFIQLGPRMTLSSLVSTLRTARQSKLDPAQYEIWAKVHKSLEEHQDKAVLGVVTEFYQALLNILEESSLVIRLMSRFSWVEKVIRWAYGITKQVPYVSPQKEAYGYYRDYMRALDQAA